MPVNGLVTMTPTSIASTGTGNSSSINTNGSVTFSSCVTLSLNGVFASSYDNYMVVVRSSEAEDFTTYTFRLRASGTDNSTSSSYVSQNLAASSTTISASRNTTSLAYLNYGSSQNRTGTTLYLFGPYLAQATAFRSVTASGNAGAYIYDNAGTHNQSTAYDGISFINTTKPISGLVTVYGFNQ